MFIKEYFQGIKNYSKFSATASRYLILQGAKTTILGIEKEWSDKE